MRQALAPIESSVTGPTRLRVAPISSLPESLAVGAGNALFVDGSCSHPDGEVVDLSVLVDEVEHPVMAVGQPPPGRLSGSDYWWAIVAFDPVVRPRLARLALRARLADGREAQGDLGAIELRPAVDAPAPPQIPGAGAESQQPLISVCMATYEPPLDLFRRQVESIRAQTHGNWTCVISDDRSSPERLDAMREVLVGDDRFLLYPSTERLGFYRNFERALALAPREAAHVALCDQDDRWYPDKLETLLRALDDGSKLAYSDMRIVDRRSAVISDTYWSYRRNNYTNFGSLLMANTVTGAASLFRREVLDYALPFPPRLGNAYHDHWIALVAMALGRLTYVDRPLYDYVQHRGAALGHARANAAHRCGADRRERARLIAERLRKLRRERFHPGWRYLYFDLWCPIALTATVADLRCRSVMEPRKLRTLRRFADSPSGIAWLAGRSARNSLGATETLRRERALLAALAWRRLVGWRTRLQRAAPPGVGPSPAAPGPPRQGARRPAPASSHNRRPPEGRGDWLEPILVDYFTRDGSTLMMRLLLSSPQIAVEREYPYERKYFSYLWRWSRIVERGDWPSDAWSPRAFGSLAQERQAAMLGPMPWRPRELIESDPDGPMSDRLFDLAWSEFSRRAVRATCSDSDDPRADVRYYAEKHLNTWQVDLGALPPHRVVALLRDPRDTYVSIGSFDGTKPAAGRSRGGVTDRDRLYQVVDRHRNRLRWIAGLLESGSSPVVPYEELVLDLPGTARRLASWLDVELDPEAVARDRVLRTRHVTAASPADSIGRWRRELDPEVAEVFTRELRSELRAVGLEA